MRIGVTFLSFLILLFSLLIVPQSATAQAPASDQSPGTNHPGTVNKSFNEGMGGVIIKVNELESKISEKRNDVREKVRLKLLTDSFLKTQDAVNKAYTDAKSVNCKSDSAKLNVTFEEVYKTVGYWWAMSQEIQRVEGRVLNPFLSNSWWAAPPERKCEILQDENIHQSAIKAYNDAEASSKKYGQEIEVLSRELSDLYASRDKISG